MTTNEKKAVSLTAKYLRTLDQKAFADAVKKAQNNEDGLPELADILDVLVDLSEAC